MTYWSVNFIFLGISAVVLLVAVLVRRPRGLFWGSLVASFVLLGVLTAIFDNLMIDAGRGARDGRGARGARTPEAEERGVRAE